ncbi:gamma-glutamylcyclotransferase family protein [Ureibacillus thermophilus]|nr:gamma-glutamylcyclotransferase family protein [Ureibacillus thermophilus]
MIRNFFVYGTLMTGCSNHHVIPPNSIEKIQKATIENVELYSHICGEYPCMVEGNSKVFGEVITIKESHFKKAQQAMDLLEDYDENAPKHKNLYNREIKNVILETGEIIQAYVYMYNSKLKGLGKRISEGNWKTWVDQK